ncbi:MAG TPA: type II secretion system ATPase GspE [Chlamydiales bacterium]|nr:type II secretion system ATPase GspE [Chlamydiales bacterium]
MDEKQLAERFGLQVHEEIHAFPFVRDRMVVIPYGMAKQKKILPIDETNASFVVAISDPLDYEVITELRMLLKKQITVVYSPKSVIETAIERCYHQREEETKRLFSDLEKESTLKNEEEDTYDLLEQADGNPVIRMVNTIILEAIQFGASDIHFEPTETGLMIRYRMDGILQQKHTPPREYQLQIITRLKVMAKMDIAEHRLPQDGRIKLHHGGREIDFRVSTLPIVHGERIVIRILDKGNVVLGLDRIGMNELHLKQMRKLISIPEGIVLVSGPTGSGKTTTLYSAISELNDCERNIITVEDPVEYKITGISQVSVNPRIDLTFAKGLRHILRQDPDVIMIGEIRDRETAEIAIQASLTGHLVFSTIHTNDAPSALTRLADMGIEPYLLASSILGVVAQRLVRKICSDCKTAYLPDDEELAEMGLEIRVPFYRGVGCETCLGTGFKGRLAIYEIMLVTPKIKSQVMVSQDAEDLRKVAVMQGMASLFENGVEKVIAGLTTSKEVLRVTREK